MMVTGWYYPEPEKELALVQERLAALAQEFRGAPSIDDHSQDEIWRLQVKRDRILKQISDNAKQ